jgi:hypothetical protein
MLGRPRSVHPRLYRCLLGTRKTIRSQITNISAKLERMLSICRLSDGQCMLAGAGVQVLRVLLMEPSGSRINFH